jgi:hypothetical protein
MSLWKRSITRDTHLLLEVRLSHPGSYNHDMQSLRLLVDGTDVDQPPERDTAEVLADLNIVFKEVCC